MRKLLLSIYIVLGISSNLEMTCFPDDSVVRNPPASAGDARDVGSSLGWEDPLE